MGRKLLALLILRLAAFAAIELGPVFNGSLGPVSEPACLGERVGEDAGDCHLHEQALPPAPRDRVEPSVFCGFAPRYHAVSGVSGAPSLLRSRAPPVLG